MDRDIWSQAEKLNKQHRRKRIRYRILSIPVCLVVFITTYAMILPAITLNSTPDTYCGFEEHEHGNACYTTPGKPAYKRISCAVQEELGDGEYVIHRHDSFCFDDSGELICTLPEQEEHTHTAECFKDEELVCDRKTGVVHRHTADCVETVPATEPKGLICKKTEHKHTEACFAESGEDVSGIQRLPVRAQTATGAENIRIEVVDDVPDSGCYKARVASGSELTEGKDVRFLWYKSIDGGKTYEAVEKKLFSINGTVMSNVSDDGETALNLALDGRTITETQTSVKYRVTLVLDGVEYENVSAEIENSTYHFSVLNGSFESPDLTDHQYQEFVPEETAGLYWKTTAENEEGFTSGDKQHIYGGVEAVKGAHYIEIVNTGTDEHKTNAANWHGQGTASDGKQYAEINAGAQGALYQTIITVPGTTMNWSVDHNGRQGTDTMAVVMMPEKTAKNIRTQTQLNAVLKSPDTYQATVINNLTADKGAWTTHSGQYAVPEGQHETRFFFVSVSAAGNNAYIGNHIDNVWFSQKIPPASTTKPYFTVTKTVRGDLSEAELQTLSDQLTFELQRSSGRNAASGFTTQKTFKAGEIGDWEKNDDGTWVLSTRISMESYTTGYYYRIVESNAELSGYVLSASDTNTAVKLTSSTAGEFTFTNVYTGTGCELELKKVVNSSDTTGQFTFTVSYTDADGNEKTQSLLLRHNETARITGIKKGSSVTVVEEPVNGYTVSVKDSASGQFLSDSNRYTFILSDDVGITVYNTASVVLPETGGIGITLFLYGGLGLMLIAATAGYLLRRAYERGSG